jgi:hypothetical protein
MNFESMLDSKLPVSQPSASRSSSPNLWQAAFMLLGDVWARKHFPDRTNDPSILREPFMSKKDASLILAQVRLHPLEISFHLTQSSSLHSPSLTASFSWFWLHPCHTVLFRPGLTTMQPPPQRHPLPRLAAPIAGSKRSPWRAARPRRTR